MLSVAIVMLVFEQPSERVVRGTQEYFELIELWQGNYWYQLMIHAGYSIGVLILSPLFILWQVLGLMYLGSYLYRIDFFTQGFCGATFIKIFIIGIVSTLLCIAPQMLMTDINPEVIPLLSSISAVFVAFVYAHIVIKLCKSKRVYQSISGYR